MALTIDRRAFLKIAAGGAIGTAAAASAYSMRGRARGLYIDLTRPHVQPPLETPAGQEVLYNGIALPSPWPPYRRQLERDPQFPPYLMRPPAVIPIDVGRQLFVDDFLIEECELDRAVSRGRVHRRQPGPPPGQRRGSVRRAGAWARPRPTAMPFSDGVWFDPGRSACSKCGTPAATAAAPASRCPSDGAEWRRPLLGRRARHQHRARPSCATRAPSGWITASQSRQLRFKMMVYVRELAAGCGATSRPTASTGARPGLAGHPAIDRRSSSTRSATSGSTACATAGAAAFAGATAATWSRANSAR